YVITDISVMSSPFLIFFLFVSDQLPNPPSFPTRRSSDLSILLHSAFFIVQLSHPYMTTGKTIALTRWTFVNKVTFLLFNVLSRLDRKSTRLNSSHVSISYAVFCLNKKINNYN